ncbi:hypothetical protein CI109_100934 [Kwoniella shandongensis]|uniref:Uncharacterized protein n=1 Tax=Kwoniella shandongensis TaxID=1734106 RepID=A0A5M6C4G7_9TREE|nr:uncharacterized protein CI109_001400 [Kwoniella shandongensis]KAA5529998.1 hypothetical protein CI109_001400 [Kwoniella shandongensis]
MPSFTFTTVATFALVASASIVSAAPVVSRGKPTTYAEGYLEDYDVYHSRYLALDCQSQHNSTFFDDCCHPLLANETLEDDRAAYCTPNATAASSVSATVVADASITAAATASADVGAAEEYCEASSSVASVINATSTAYDNIATAVSNATAAATATATLEAVADYAGHRNHKSWKGKNNSSSSAAPAATASATAEESESASPAYEAESTSSSEAEAAYTPSSTSEAAPAQTSAASSGGSSGEVMTGGYATYFYQGGNAGACGTVHSDSDYVIAIDSNGWWSDYASNNNSPYCGKSITLTNTNNGKSVTAVVADVCPSCVSSNSLDLSVGAFNAIASESDGQVPITWVWA